MKQNIVSTLTAAIAIMLALAACHDEQAVINTGHTAPLNNISIARAGGTTWATISDGSSLNLGVKDATEKEKQASFSYDAANNTWVEKTGSDEIACRTGNYPAYAYGMIGITHTATNYYEKIPVTWVGKLATTLTGDVLTSQPIEMNIAAARFKITFIGAYGEDDAEMPNFRIRYLRGSCMSDDFTSPTDPYTEPHSPISSNESIWEHRSNDGYSNGNISARAIQAGEILFIINNDYSTNEIYSYKEYEVPAPADIVLKAGKEYHYTIRLTASGKAEIIDQKITDFVAGGTFEIKKYQGVATEADLRQLSTDWNANPITALAKWEDTPGSKIIRLLNNIEMSDEPFVPIGSKHSFDAVFDGGGNTIRGIKVETTSGGLFGTNKGTIHGVHLRQAIIKGEEYAGGIAGRNEGTIAACSVEGTIEAPIHSAGGIAGIGQSCTMTGCYTLTTTVTTPIVGEITGENEKTTIDGCYAFDTQAELMAKTDLTRLMNNALSRLTNPPAYSWMKVSNDIPLLMKIAPVYVKKTITTEAELRELSADWATNRDDALAKWEHEPGSKTIYLGANIRMSDELFIPIARRYNKFTGIFDGQGYTISGLKIEDLNYYIGLFGETDTGSIIRNLHVRQASIKGYHLVGGIVGMNGGFIVGCSFEGTVQATNKYAGGIVGRNTSVKSTSGTLGCYSLATSIKAPDNSYGIAGDHSINSGPIEGCHWLTGDINQPTEATTGGPTPNCHSFTNVNNFYGNAKQLVDLMNTAIEGKTEMRWRAVANDYPELYTP